MFVLKEVIDLYRRLNGSVFVCFLNASKAFDRVNHRTLSKQLGAGGGGGVPEYIIYCEYSLTGIRTRICVSNGEMHTQINLKEQMVLDKGDIIPLHFQCVCR